MIRHFAELCEQCKKIGVTASGLSDRVANGCNNTKKLYDWLISWCGFQDWDHIIKILSTVTIRRFGREQDIEENIERTLSSCFNSPIIVREQIITFISCNESDAGATTPKQLLMHIKGFMLSEAQTWTYYQLIKDKNKIIWVVAGTHGDSNDEIENPAHVVRALWEDSGRQRILKVAATWQAMEDNSSIQMALMRLALHLPRSAQALLQDVGTWKTGLNYEIAGTFGVQGRNDLTNLPWADYEKFLNPSDTRKIDDISNHTQEVELLNSAMDEVTWGRICELLTNKFQAIKDPDLLRKTKSLWKSWESSLSSNQVERKKLLTDLLHPAAEGANILGTLRVGIITVDILSEGLKCLLIVAAALGDENSTWFSFPNIGSVRTIALCYWGGPSDAKRGPRLLDEGGGILLGSERADIVILSGYHGPPGEIEEASFVDSASDRDNFAKSRGPKKLLITNSKRMRSLISSRTLIDIRDYLYEELGSRKHQREKNILANMEAFNGN